MPHSIHRDTEDTQFLARPGPNGLEADAWRMWRIASELTAGMDLLADLGPSVSIFGSARTPTSHPMYLAAHTLSKRLVKEGFGVITGGGPGIMAAANYGAQDAGGESVGLEIELPFEPGESAGRTTRNIRFRYFFVRKVMLVKYAMGFVVFPGGAGSLDELCEVFCLVQTGKIRRFPIVLFGADYWSGMMDWLWKTVVAEGNITAEEMAALTVTDSIEDVVCVLRAARDEPAL
jgi:uncharacterized protein (TIGR00730 family)